MNVSKWNTYYLAKALLLKYGEIVTEEQVEAEIKMMLGTDSRTITKYEKALVEYGYVFLEPANEAYTKANYNLNVKAIKWEKPLSPKQYVNKLQKEKEERENIPSQV